MLYAMETYDSPIDVDATARTVGVTLTPDRGGTPRDLAGARRRVALDIGRYDDHRLSSARGKPYARRISR